MATFTLHGNSFELTEKSHDFLESYIKRMRTYIETHDISESYLDDILDRIVEKLQAKKMLKDADIIKIVNEIGEPEDIFTSEAKKVTEEKAIPKKPAMKKHLKKDLENGIIFGVCAGMAEYFEMNVLWFRLAFIVSVFFFGTGLLLYIILGLLLPKSNKESSTPIVVEGKGLINYLSGFVAYGFRGAFRIILGIVFAIIGCVAFGLFIGGSLASGFLISGGITLSNQVIPAIVPEGLKIGVPLLTIILLILSITLFSSIFGKTLLGKTGWIGLFTLFAISIICITSGAFRAFQEYTWGAYRTSEVSYDFTGNTLNVINDFRDFRDDSLEMPIGHQVRIIHEANRSDITVRTTDYLQTKDATTSEQIFANMTENIYSYSGGLLRIERGSGAYFKNVVPFAFPRRRIEILIPEGVTILGQYNYYNDEEGHEMYYR